ncbi:hypothetical protein [Streptomyces stelliscabiei]|uniref:Uncharacterized protein n=1 Tax=Streptomyces stelliscabiei TaxID=146820 RepID=A0A8I0TLV3_9ACTN|nr:hypothetical protein [Streptomyces stelliscabiei]KND38768.1 hypothetical protein IQ64_38240 [Streptomyces stelliscabiei]MBE1593900.1 hypothetical protein [Streptomyces stelliscabiei]MDX2522288.1 hypothetical protein [Streptomyces stelliscabiei]
MHRRQAPRAYADRRLARLLFKIFEDRNGLAWWTPTRRLTVLAVLHGEVGYPGDLVGLIMEEIRRGAIVPHRHPYEIPEYQLVSFAPVSFVDELPLLQYLSDLGLLFLYEEADPPADVPRYGLPDAITRQLLDAGLAGHLDSIDRRLSNLGTPSDELASYERLMAMALASATAGGGHPAFFLPEASRIWAAETEPQWARFAEAEAFLLNELPPRLLGFPDVVELARSACEVRARLLDGPIDLEREFAPVLHAARSLGASHRDAALATVDGITLAPEGLTLVTGLYPGDTVIATVTAAPELALHRAETALTGLADVPGLLLVPGTRLWMPPLHDMVLHEIYAGDPPREVHTHAPF